VHYFDKAQLEFWRVREAEEREAAAKSLDGARASHLKLADSYAILIAQAVGDAPKDASM